MVQFLGSIIDSILFHPVSNSTYSKNSEKIRSAEDNVEIGSKICEIIGTQELLCGKIKNLLKENLTFFEQPEEEILLSNQEEAMIKSLTALVVDDEEELMDLTEEEKELLFLCSTSIEKQNFPPKILEKQVEETFEKPAKNTASRS